MSLFYSTNSTISENNELLSINVLKKIDVPILSEKLYHFRKE